MLSLLIDTSTERGLIALGLDGKVIGEAQLPVGLHNSHTLFRELDALINRLHIKKKDLKLIICGIGPGSYTGMRVAASAAKGLSFGLQIPLIGVSTLSGLVPEGDGPFAAIIDAKISGVYLQKGIKEKGKVTFLSPPAAIPLEALDKEIEGVKGLVTPKMEPLRTKLASYAASKLLWEEKGLSAEQMTALGLQKFNAGDYSAEGQLDLLYLRKTQAEIERGL